VARLAVALGVAGLLLAGSARELHADGPAVSLGEVSIAATSAVELDAGAFRSMAADAVQAIDAHSLPKGRGVVLSVSLVRLDARAASGEVSCTVSATLRDRARGAVFAVLEGSARGQDGDPRRLASLRRAVVRAAVGSAIARVPEVLHKGRRRD
jgi:hypothetical protein